LLALRSKVQFFNYKGNVLKIYNTIIWYKMLSYRRETALQGAL